MKDRKKSITEKKSTYTQNMLDIIINTIITTFIERINSSKFESEALV